MPCYAPTSSVASYQLLPQTPVAEPSDLFERIEYGFQRKVLWTTAFRRYRDQTSEVLPSQVIARYEFVLKVERWSPQTARDFEAFVDSVKGSAYPFNYTAPDDGVVYVVRFKEDSQGFSLPSATVRVGEFILETVGDYNNSVDNDAAYPPHVESITTSSTTTTTT